MRELGLTGLSEDGRFLVAHDSLTDESFHIPTDVRLTSLLNSSSATTAKRPDRQAGAREPSMESTLSPREIQARIRRGDSPEKVADDSGMALETIHGFAVPVLAEREYIVEQSRKTPLRRQHVSNAPGMLLGTMVDESVSARGATVDTVPWDSWRREDGRWTIVVSPEGFAAPATFIFDVKGRYVLPADEAAHDLVGDFVVTEPSEMAIANALREDPVSEPVAEVGSVVAEDPAPLPIDEPVEDFEAVAVEPAPAPRAPVVDASDPFGLPVQRELIEQPASVASLKEARDRRALEQMAFGMDDVIEAPAEADDVEITENQSYLTPKPAKKKPERRHVPSWDEIMFGGSRRD